MMDKAWEDCVPAVSMPMAAFMAVRTSGGRSVEVRTIRESRLS